MEDGNKLLDNAKKSDESKPKIKRFFSDTQWRIITSVIGIAVVNLNTFN